MSENYEKIIVTHKECPHCPGAKELLKDKLNNGTIKRMEIGTDKGALEFAKKYNIKTVPSIVLKDKVTNFTEVCELSKDGTKALCKDKEVDL